LRHFTKFDSFRGALRKSGLKMSLQKKFTFANISSRDEFLGFYRTFITINNTKQGIERLSEYKHVLANILHSRYVARTPQFEARSPGRRSNVENASVTCRSLISNARASRVN